MANVTTSYPALANFRITISTIGVSTSGTRGFGRVNVYGRRRVPRPPARITAYFISHLKLVSYYDWGTGILDQPERAASQYPATSCQVKRLRHLSRTVAPIRFRILRSFMQRDISTANARGSTRI